MRELTGAILALGISFLTVGSAAAESVTSLKPKSLVNALQNAGYRATLSKMEDGNPLIETSADGVPVKIAFTDCKSNKDCKTIEFLGVWDCSGKIGKCKSVVETLNKNESPMHFENSFEEDTVVTYQYLLFDEVGISENLFIRNLEIFSFYNLQFNNEVAK